MTTSWGSQIAQALRPVRNGGDRTDTTVLVYTASVTFEEILDARVTSEELRAET